MFRKAAYASIATLGLMMVAAAPAQASPWDGHYHVQYRLSTWGEKTFHNYFEARIFQQAQASRGYETSLVSHGLHWDVRYRLPQWRTYRTVDSHHQAHSLERFLEHRGYQVRLVHH